jgi:hypothetical protein
MKSRNLNFLEPSGPLQACNGTALPFFTLYYEVIKLWSTGWVVHVACVEEKRCLQGFGKEACMKEIVSQSQALGVENTEIELKEI